MGVNGLWRLLLPIGRRVSIEVLEGKVLAIDASIWLTQFLKAMRDPESGRVQPAAHLIGFFRRLAKLRYHGIRPVLVFDGATPIIKLRELQKRRQRREHFAPNSEAAFKRMAKRILIQEIKKSKKHELRDTSVAPGFNLPDSDNLKECTNNVGGIIGDDNNEHLAKLQQSRNSLANDKTSDRADETITDPVVEGSKVIKSKQTSFQEKELRKEGRDKCTLPLQNPTLETSEEIARALQEEEWGVINDQDSDEKNNDWGKGGYTGTTKLKLLEKSHKEIISVDIDHLSAMTSHERKDAIENARRSQRMQSRKEFMPVAGQPGSYSKTQLRNFLRSSRLNQSISKVAQEITQKNSSLGDHVAAYPSRRIFFEKVDAKGTNSLIVIDEKDSRPNDSDSEVEWDDGESGKFESKEIENRSSPKRRAIFLNSSDEEGSVVDCGRGDGTSSFQAGLKVDHEKDQSIKSLEHSPGSIVTSGPSEGGFLKENGHVGKSQNGDAQWNLVPVQHNIPISCTKKDGDLYNETNSKQLIKETKAVLEPRVLDNTGPRGEGVMVGTEDSKSSSEDDACQEFDQRCALPCSMPLDRDGNEESQAEPSVIAQIKNFKWTGEDTSTKKEIHSDIEECEEEESIDWVDGDDTSSPFDSSNLNQRNRLEIASDEIIYPKKNKVNKDSGENIDLRKPKLKSELEEEEEATYWIDGDDSTHEFDSFHRKEISNVKTTNAAVIVKGGTSNDGGENIENSQKGEIQWTMEKEKDVFNVAALRQAQSTATNLTDWAGRAFRRAIAQHAKASFPQSETLKMKSIISSDFEDLDKKESDFTQDNIVGSKEAGSIAFSCSDKIKDKTNTSVEHDKTVNSASNGTTKYVSNPHATGTGVEDNNDLLAQEERIEREMKRQNRDMDTVTDEMKLEIISLIKLFGIPYVDAVSEAEAECVALEDLGLVDGIVTEDSDAFVFGAKTVYRNIFDDQKFVEVYKAEDAWRELGLGRNQMVALAMLLGGDYTDGVKGVGIVNAMEILQVFDTSLNVKSGLENFRKWLDDFDLSDATGLPFTEAEAPLGIESFHKTHKSFRSRWVCPKNFPANDVLNAYLNPVVDKSSDPFSWGSPDVERLMSFCSLNMGWEASDTRRMLEPIVERLELGMRQTRLDIFMNYKDNIQFANIKSKRLRNVLQDKQRDQLDKSKKRKAG